MLPWVSTVESHVDWFYFENVVLIPWYGNTFHQADHWIDQGFPAFRGGRLSRPHGILTAEGGDDGSDALT